MGQRRPVAHSNNRRERTAIAAEQTNLPFQLVRHFAFGKFQPQRGSHHGKCFFRQIDGHANRCHFFLVLDLSKSFDQAVGLYKLDFVEQLRKRVELANRDRSRLDRNRPLFGLFDDLPCQLSDRHSRASQFDIDSGTLLLELCTIAVVAQDDLVFGRKQQITRVASEPGQVRHVRFISDKNR